MSDEEITEEMIAEVASGLSSLSSQSSRSKRRKRGAKAKLVGRKAKGTQKVSGVVSIFFLLLNDYFVFYLHEVKNVLSYLILFVVREQDFQSHFAESSTQNEQPDLSVDTPSIPESSLEISDLSVSLMSESIFGTTSEAPSELDVTPDVPGSSIKKKRRKRGKRLIGKKRKGFRKAADSKAVRVF
jgi:hypothetical protein